MCRGEISLASRSLLAKSQHVVKLPRHRQDVSQHHAHCGFWWLLLLRGLTSAAVSLAPHLALQRGRLRERVLFVLSGWNCAKADSVNK